MPGLFEQECTPFPPTPFKMCTSGVPSPLALRLPRVDLAQARWASIIFKIHAGHFLPPTALIRMCLPGIRIETLTNIHNIVIYPTWGLLFYPSHLIPSHSSSVTRASTVILTFPLGLTFASFPSLEHVGCPKPVLVPPIRHFATSDHQVISVIVTHRCGISSVWPSPQADVKDVTPTTKALLNQRSPFSANEHMCSTFTSRGRSQARPPT